MTDEQRAAIKSGIAAMEYCGWTSRVPVLRALLSASKPAAQSAEPITKEWCMKMAALEPDDGAISAGVPNAKTGWKLVPIEPTDAMTYIGQKHRYESVWSIGAIYREMLSAAPQPSQTAQSSCPLCGGSQATWKCTCDPIWPGYAKPRTGRPLTEDTIKQIAQRFGAIYEDRIVFHDDKFTEFAEALVTAAQPSQSAVVLDDERAAFIAWHKERHGYWTESKTCQDRFEVWQSARAVSPQPVAQPVAQTERALTEAQARAIWKASAEFDTGEDGVEVVDYEKARDKEIARILLTAAHPETGEKGKIP